MNRRSRVALASLALLAALAAPAAARISPYVRLDYGGNELRMSDADQMVMGNQAWLRSLGYPASFKKVGSAYGGGGAAGLWLFPAFRVGATYSYQKALNASHVLVPGSLNWGDDAELRMREIGGEAVLRVQRWYGFTLGATVAQGRAQLLEKMVQETSTSQYYMSDTGQRIKPTYGGFVGFDQTNPNGVAGYVHVGWVYRDMGHLHGSYVESDGTASASGTSSSIWLDYSGWYAKVGIGYDLVH